MLDDFTKTTQTLRAQGKAFATAIVVRSEPPISGKPGDKAIVQSNGKMLGWVGGECTQSIVVQEALRVMEAGKPQLIRITPSNEALGQQGIVEHTMNCHSGGTLDIYIEPTLPPPHMVIVGRSPVGRALAKLGKALDYFVTVVAPGVDQENYPEVDAFRQRIDFEDFAISSQTYLVLTTQGEYDEEALEEAVKTSCGYIAFVASRKKADAVFDYLKKKGISAGKLQQVKTPAGLDIKARFPEEIAVSILAEIIQVRRTATLALIESAETPSTAPPTKNHQDPICGMWVQSDPPLHTSDFQGIPYYFCCAKCKHQFDQNPEKYIEFS